MRKTTAIKFIQCILSAIAFSFPLGAHGAPNTTQDENTQQLEQDRLVQIPTRPDVKVPVFWMPRKGADATVMLMPGGNGGFGKMVDGKPTGGNFLVRSRDYFAAQGLNVAVVGRPSDVEDLDYAYRTSGEHLGDLQQIVAAIKQLSNQPVWIVGTSRGTISAAAAAVAFGNGQLAGIVLTSSVVNRKKPGAIPSQNLDAIKIPVLVLHHEKDGCVHCKPNEVQWIMRGLNNAPIKKQIMVNGGANPTGDPCAGQHWHGFIGMEQEAVDIISNWIKKPVTWIRSRADTITGELLSGDVSRKTTLIIDDMISTDSTIANTVRVCDRGGAISIHAAATHGLFTGGATTVLADPLLKRLVVADTITAEAPHSSALSAKVTGIPSAGPFGEAIRRMHDGDSIVDLLG